MSFTAKELSACIKGLAPPGFKFKKGVGACILEKKENGLLHRLTYTHRSTGSGMSIKLAIISIYSNLIQESFSSVNEKCNLKLDDDGFVMYLLDDSNSKHDMLRSEILSKEIASPEQFNLMVGPCLKWLLENYDLKRVAFFGNLRNIAELFLSLPMDELGRYTSGSRFYYIIPLVLINIQHPRSGEMIQKLKKRLYDSMTMNASYLRTYEVFCDLFCDNDLTIKDQLIEQVSVNSEISDSLFSPTDIDWHELELILGRKIFDVNPDEPPIQYLYVSQSEYLAERPKIDLNAMINSDDFKSKFTDYDLLVSFDELICFSQENDINIFLFPWAHEPYYRRMINLLTRHRCSSIMLHTLHFYLERMN